MKKGISLVVLVITIIVMIIISGVIVMTIMDVNIFNVAKNTVVTSNIKSIEEEISVRKTHLKVTNMEYENPLSLNTEDSALVINKKIVDENSIRYYLVDTSIVNTKSNYSNYTQNLDTQIDVTELSDVYIVDSDLKVYYIDSNKVAYPNLNLPKPIYANYSDLPTAEGWIPIFTKEQLKKVGTTTAGVSIPEVGKTFDFTPTSKFILMTNINLEGETWTPLEELKGTFEGNNRTISNMKITAYTSRIGLFKTNSGYIRNLKLTSVDINCTAATSNISAYIGALVAYNTGSIENCNTSGILSVNIASNNYELSVGGIVAYTNSVNSEILNCKNSINLNAINYRDIYIGGIVGKIDNAKTVASCSNKGNVVVKNGGYGIANVYAGGVSGKATNTLTFKDSFNSGNVSGIRNGPYYMYIAGLSGALGANTKLENCYNTADVKSSFESGNESNTYVSGITASSVATNNIIGCYNTGNITNTLQGVTNITSGLVIGYSNITNCYNSGEVNGYGDIISGVAAYTAGTTNTTTLVETYNTGKIIGSYGSVAGVSSVVSSSNSDTGWPKVTNCYNTGEVLTTTLVANVSGVTNGAIEIIGSYNTGDITCDSPKVGGVATKATKVTNCYNTGNIVANYISSATGNLLLGGVVSDKCDVRYSYNIGNVTASTNLSKTVRVGGIIGQNTDSYKTDYTYNTGNINVTINTGNAQVGGIAGRTGKSGSQGSVSNSFNTGNITVGGNSTDLNNNIGGIAGYLNDANLSITYNIGQVVNNNPGGYSGSLVGKEYYGGGYGIASTGRWLVNTNALAIGTTNYTNARTSIIQYNSTQMKIQANYSGFTFTSSGAWTIEAGITTPYLKNLPKPASVNLP